jgi:hypothetical protein
MEIQYSQLKLNHLNDLPSTKAARGGIFSGVFQQGRQGTSQGQEDFELSWYLFFQHRESHLVGFCIFESDCAYKLPISDIFHAFCRCLVLEDKLNSVGRVHNLASDAIYQLPKFTG